jgi:hypothetical protein
MGRCCPSCYRFWVWLQKSLIVSRTKGRNWSVKRRSRWVRIPNDGMMKIWHSLLNCLEQVSFIKNTFSLSI